MSSPADEPPATEPTATEPPVAQTAVDFIEAVRLPPLAPQLFSQLYSSLL